MICISYDTFFLTESPFNNIHDEIKNHPMSFLWRKMPWFKWFFTGTLTKNDVGFISDQRIGQIYVPILIMHAKVSAFFISAMSLQSHFRGLRILLPSFSITPKSWQKPKSWQTSQFQCKQRIPPKKILPIILQKNPTKKSS